MTTINGLFPTEADIQKWDEWFALVGKSREWGVVKELFPDDLCKQIIWARIMEMNRLSDVTKSKDKEVDNVVDRRGSAEGCGGILGGINHQRDVGNNSGT